MSRRGQAGLSGLIGSGRPCARICFVLLLFFFQALLHVQMISRFCFFGIIPISVGPSGMWKPSQVIVLQLSDGRRGTGDLLPFMQALLPFLMSFFMKHTGGGLWLLLSAGQCGHDVSWALSEVKREALCINTKMFYSLQQYTTTHTHIKYCNWYRL